MTGTDPDAEASGRATVEGRVESLAVLPADAGVVDHDGLPGLDSWSVALRQGLDDQLAGGLALGHGDGGRLAEVALDRRQVAGGGWFADSPTSTGEAEELALSLVLVDGPGSAAESGSSPQAARVPTRTRAAPRATGGRTSGMQRVRHSAPWRGRA